MRSRHAIIYVPGLGDTKAEGRRLALGFWRWFGATAVLHQMVWADGESFQSKLEGLLGHIDRLVADGYTVSLVGESAGASAALTAYAERSQSIHRVVFVCGKLAHADTIHPVTYQRNPAFKESMEALPDSLAKLPEESRRRIRSIAPLRDRVVPPADTRIAGADHKTIPSVGHSVSIALSLTVFSWWIVRHIKRP